MAEPGFGKSKPSLPPSFADPFQSGHALGQIAAAAHGLETALEEQRKREVLLVEENRHLREAGRKLADELTDLIQKITSLEETATQNAIALEVAAREKALLREEFLQRERAAHEAEEKAAAFRSAEALARENQIREEIAQVSKFATVEAGIEREKLTATIAELRAEAESYRTSAGNEINQLRHEVKNLQDTLKNVRAESTRKSDLAQANEVANQNRIDELENSLVELGTNHRAAQDRISELTTRLGYERTAGRATAAELKSLQDEVELRIRNVLAESENTLRQTRNELEARINQLEYESQMDVEIARGENRTRIEDLEKSVRALSDELEAERKLKHEAESARNEAETERDTALRDSGARTRRLELECANLTEELRLTLETSERRINEVRTEARNEKARLIREAAENLAQARAREDEARERANTAAANSERLAREAETSKRTIARLRSPAESGVDLLRETCENLKQEREELMRLRAEERATAQTEISRLRAEIESTAKLARETQARRVAAEVEELRWENEAAAETASTDSPLAEVLRRKEVEIERARSRLARVPPIDN